LLVRYVTEARFVNPQQIPVNCPFAAKVNHPQSRDGLMRTDYNGEGEPTIYPNSRNGTLTLMLLSLSNFLFSQTACMINW
jgi:catalase